MIESAVYSRVTGDGAVAALIGTRMYPTKLEQGATMPAVSFQHVSEERKGTFGSPATMPGVLMQIDCWDSTFTGVKTLARAVRLALDNFKGLSAGETISAVLLENQTDQYEEAVKLYRVLMEFRIWWQES